MNCKLSTSPLPGIWVIETLARSNEVEISFLLDLLEKFPQTSDDLGRNARELVSFRILESFLFRGAQSNSVSSSSSPKIALDPSESCEHVLQQILLETPALNLKAAGPEMWKWDVQSFIAHKRSSLDNHALLQLKDAILTGSHSFLASFKEQSGLPFGNQPERGLLADDHKCNGIMHKFEGTDSNTRIVEGHDQFISPALANNANLLHSDLPNENLLPVKRKRSATTKNLEGKSSKDQIISKNGCENHTKYFKKNNISQCGQDFGGNLTPSGVNEQLADKTTMSTQYSQRERCSLVRNINVGEIGLNGSAEDNNNECISLKDIGGCDEVLPCEKQGPHCNTELPIDKSNDEHGLENEIGEAGQKEGFCDLECTEDIDKFEPHIKANVQDGDEEKNIHLSSDTHCTYIQYSSATNCSDLDVLADICALLVESSELLGCSLGNRACLGGMGQNRPPGDVDNEFTSSKGLIGHENVMHHEKQVCHDGTNVPNENFVKEPEQNRDAENASDKEGFHELKTTGGYKDRFEQESKRNFPDLGDTEDVDMSSDSDEYRDERTDITTKKNAFLSSQCTFSQAVDISTQLNVCVKCNKGGKLLVCSTNSCPLVIHETCSGSQASFGTKGEFYCPFCACSQAISKYMDAKKKVSLTRKDLANFVCLGARKNLKKKPEHDDDLHKSNELNKQDIAERINNHQTRRKLEYGQAEYSTLSSGDNHSLGGKSVDSTNGKPHPLSKDKKGKKNKGQKFHSSRVHGRHHKASKAILKSQGENASIQIPEKSNGSESHAEIRSKKGVLLSPETHLPREDKCSLHTEPVDAQERSEEGNENSGVSKYSIRVHKHKRQYSYPECPQLRRKRLPWTTAEKEKLKEGMRRFCSPHDKYIPWKKILDFGAGVFEESRSTIDLKDKWRNLCKSSPKS